MTRLNLLILMLCGVLWAGGCTTTRPVDLGRPEEAAPTLEALQEAVQGRRVRLEWHDGTRRTVYATMYLDSTARLALDGPEGRALVPLADLRRLHLPGRRKNLIEGLAVGVLTGMAGAFGSLLASNQTFDDAARGPRLLVPVGGVLGLVAGALWSHPKTYHFVPPPPPPAIAARPEPTPEPQEQPPPPVEEPPATEELPPTEEPPAAEETPTAEEPTPFPEEPPPVVEEPSPVAEETAAEEETLPAQRDTLDRQRGGWTVVVGSHTDQAQADALATRFRQSLAGAGYPIAVLADADGAVMRYRVVVGQFTSVAAATEARSALAGRIPEDAWVYRIETR